MSVCDPPDRNGALGRFLSRLPQPVVEHVEKGFREVTVLTRFSLISFPLIGGRGDGATVQDARSASLLSLAHRLCELGILTQRIVHLVQRYDEEAISVFLPDTVELFEHANELIAGDKKVSAKARMCKSWDASLFESDRQLLTETLAHSIGHYWEEQWTALSIPQHMRDDEEGGQNTVIVKEELASDVVVDKAESVDKVETVSLSEPRDKRAGTAMADDGKRRKVEEGGGMSEEQKEKEMEMVRLAKGAAEELARITGNTLEEDGERVFLSGVHPAFLSARKSELNPYRTLIERTTAWHLLPKNMLPTTAPYVTCLWNLLLPLIHKYADGTSTSANWKKLEIRDIGARFWQRPAELMAVEPPLSGPSLDRVESVCRRLTEALIRRAALSLVREERDGLFRLHFLPFPVQLIGTCEFAEKSRLYSVFVRSLCECGMLPPWVECMHLLIGESEVDRKTSSHWRSSLSHAFATRIVPSLRADYLRKESCVFLSHSSDEVRVREQRRRLREYLLALWRAAEVRVPDDVSCEFAISFRVRNKSGEAVWPKDAPQLIGVAEKSGEASVCKENAGPVATEKQKKKLEKKKERMEKEVEQEEIVVLGCRVCVVGGEQDMDVDLAADFIPPLPASPLPLPPPPLSHHIPLPHTLSPSTTPGAPMVLEVPPAPTVLEVPPAPTVLDVPPAPTVLEVPPAPTVLETAVVVETRSFTDGPQASVPPRRFDHTVSPRPPSPLPVDSMRTRRPALSSRPCPISCSPLPHHAPPLPPLYRLPERRPLIMHPPQPLKEDLFRRCAQSICEVMRWTLTMEYMGNEEVVCFSGLPFQIVHGYARGGKGMFESLMCRMRELCLVPPEGHGTPLDPHCKEAAMLYSLLMLVVDVINDAGATDFGVEQAVSRLGGDFWSMETPPVAFLRVRDAEWISPPPLIRSALGEWLLPKIAQRAATRLLLGRNHFGGLVMWFLSVPHSRLGIVAPPGTSPYALFIDLLCSRGVITNIGAVDYNQDSAAHVISYAAARLRSMAPR